MENQIYKIKVSELKEHPQNAKIYGKSENVSDLIDSILENGLREPLIINKNNYVLSGNRRLKACKWLVENGHTEFSEVDCLIEDNQDETAELQSLIEHNTQRRKNWEQVGREALALIEIESKKAKERMMSGKKSDPAESVPQGDTRDIVAKKLQQANINVSGKIIDILKKAINTIDIKASEDKSIDVNLIRNELLKSKPNFTLLGKLLKSLDMLTDDEKNDIFNDRISLNALLKVKNPNNRDNCNTAKIGIVNEDTANNFDDNSQSTSKFKSKFENQEFIDAEFSETKAVEPKTIETESKSETIPVELLKQFIGALDLNLIDTAYNKTNSNMLRTNLYRIKNAVKYISYMVNQVDTDLEDNEI